MLDIVFKRKYGLIMYANFETWNSLHSEIREIIDPGDLCGSTNYNSRFIVLIGTDTEEIYLLLKLKFSQDILDLYVNAA